MDDLGKMLEVFGKNAEKFVIPDHATKKAMTAAGAKVLADELRKATPRSTKKNPKYGHLQDNVGFQNVDIDGEDDGNSVVGFGQKAYIARFLNDGTVKMKATHFADNARRDSADKVFAAEKKVLDARNGGVK